VSCDLLRAPACAAAVPVRDCRPLKQRVGARTRDGRVTGPRRTQTTDAATNRTHPAPKARPPAPGRPNCQSRIGGGAGAGPRSCARARRERRVYLILGRKLVKGLIFIMVNAADRTVTVACVLTWRLRWGCGWRWWPSVSVCSGHNSARLSSTRYNPTQLLRVVPVTPVRARTMQCLWPISIALASQPSHHLSRPSSPSCRPIGFACRTATGRAPSAVQVARSKTASGLAEGPSVRTAVREGGTDPLSVCRAARTS